MRSVASLTFITCSLLICSSGCMYGPQPQYGGYPAYQGGYGAQGGYYGGQPVYQQAPIQTLTPGQQYIPNNGVYPPGFTPTYQNPSGGLTPIPNNGSGSNAPAYNSSEINKPVPEPYNPNGAGGSSPNGSPFFDGSSTFYAPVNSPNVQPANHSNPPLQPLPNGLRESNAATNTYSPPTITPEQLPMSNAIDINSANNLNSLPPVGGPDDPFATPIPALSPQPAPAPGDSSPMAMPVFENMSNIRSNKPVTEDSEIFAHDPQYRWLRGVVSKDEPTGTWCVVYADNPHPQDEFAGHLSLASSPYLKGLNDGDVIEVSGEVDPVLKDPLGKPFYLITRLKTLTRSPISLSSATR